MDDGEGPWVCDVEGVGRRGRSIVLCGTCLGTFEVGVVDGFARKASALLLRHSYHR